MGGTASAARNSGSTRAPSMYRPSRALMPVKKRSVEAAKARRGPERQEADRRQVAEACGRHERLDRGPRAQHVDLRLELQHQRLGFYRAAGRQRRAEPRVVGHAGSRRTHHMSTKRGRCLPSSAARRAARRARTASCRACRASAAPPSHRMDRRRSSRRPKLRSSARRAGSAGAPRRRARRR